MAASFVPDYFLPLFVEDVYHKKGANRSGDSCLAIKSDLNLKPPRHDRKSYLSRSTPPPSLLLHHPWRLRTKPTRVHTDRDFS